MTCNLTWKAIITMPHYLSGLHSVESWKTSWNEFKYVKASYNVYLQSKTSMKIYLKHTAISPNNMRLVFFFPAVWRKFKLRLPQTKTGRVQRLGFWTFSIYSGWNSKVVRWRISTMKWRGSPASLSLRPRVFNKLEWIFMFHYLFK